VTLALSTPTPPPTATALPEATKTPTSNAPKLPAVGGDSGLLPGQLKSAMSTPNAWTLNLAAGVTLELVRVPAGEFLMGSDKATDPQAFSVDMPQHKVNLPEYWIGKTEVTNSQYAVFVAAAKHRAPDHWNGGRIPAGKANHPVVNVSWDDAVAFGQWASQVTGRAVQLPSEAEWEKAARGTAGQIYPWGNTAPDAQRVNFNLGVNDTTPVGQYAAAGASPYGALDMAGNAWEWTSSSYEAYPYRSDDGREAPVDPRARVLRGGSFNYGAQSVRCAFRAGYLPENRYGFIGFRVASPGL
jgi:eukaryotic-like serine/threonine-protein kinase